MVAFVIRHGVRSRGRARRLDRRGVRELVGMLCVREARFLAGWTPLGAAMGSVSISVARVIRGKAPGVLARVCL